MSATGLDRARVDRALGVALDLAGAERAAYLARLRSEDAAVGGAVAELVGFAEAADPHFERRLETLVDEELTRWQEVGEGQLDDPAAPAVGERFGAWRVLGEIGRGGMSVVYLAERSDGAYEQRAALKRLALDAGHAEGRRRFERERQILAGLRHPDIARLLDGGVDAEGRPFLVLELVEGDPIDRHCLRLGVGLEDRLRLFVRVARAVGHAHRSLVVHRDIKPANVLVSAAGEVKLLDFGIATLVDPVAGAAPPTVTLARWLTPGYATPEQIRRGPVTTASDVYQLGLLLFELLTGRRAQEVDASSSFGEIDRAVCEREVERPSAAANAAAARSVGLSLAALRRRLSGDLDTVVLTALRKDPSRRYAGADAMADDVERHLAGRALAARAESRLYRARVFVRRNRWAVAGVSALLAVLVAYAATVTVQAGRLRRQMATTERLGGFLTELMAATNSGGGGTPAGVRRVLDERAAAMVADLRELPRARADLQMVLGKVDAFIGRYPQAIAELRAALGTRRELFGEDDPRSMSSAFWLGRVLHWFGEYPEAETLYARQLAWRRERFAEDSYEVTESLDNLGCLAHSRGAWDAAELQLRAVLASRTRRFGDGTPTAITATNLADLLVDRGHAEEAEQLYRNALATFRRELGATSATTSLAADGHGMALVLAGRLEEASAELEETLGMRRLIYGESHPLIAESLRHLGLLRARQGRAEEAEALLQRAYAMHAGFYAGPFVARAEAQWAAELFALGRRDVAVEHAESARRRLAGLGLPRHPFAAIADDVLQRAEVGRPAAR